jgi:hypothetical protein
MGQAEQNRQNETARTGLPGQEYQDRALRTGLSGQAQAQDPRIRQPWQDEKESIARKA